MSAYIDTRPKRHRTDGRTHPHIHTHTYTHPTHTHIQTPTNTNTRTHKHTDTNTRAPTHAHKHTQTQTQKHTLANKLAHTRLIYLCLFRFISKLFVFYSCVASCVSQV